MQHRKDNKVRGLRAAYSIGAGDLIGTADAGQGSKHPRPAMTVRSRFARSLSGLFHLTVDGMKFVLGST